MMFRRGLDVDVLDKNDLSHFSKPESTLRILFTNSSHINGIFPANATELLGLEVQQLLQRGGHSGQMYSPGGARVLGAGWLAAQTSSFSIHERELQFLSAAR